MIRNDTTGKLAENCRHKMNYFKKVSHRRVTKSINIKNRTSIHDRPVEADGSRFGDWEMDLIVDKAGHAILNLAERSTDLMFLEKHRTDISTVPNKKIASIQDKINRRPREKINFIRTKVFFRKLT